MAEYITCVEELGGNQAASRTEVIRSELEQAAGRANARGSGVVLEGAGTVALGRGAERRLVSRLEQKFFAGSTSQCLAASDLFRRPVGAGHGMNSPRPAKASVSRRPIRTSIGPDGYDFRAAWRGYNDSLVQYLRQSPPSCDTVSQHMRARAEARLEEIAFEARRARDAAQLERVELQYGSVPPDVPLCR